MSVGVLTAQLVLNGLASRCLYALLALGFTLIWKSAAAAAIARAGYTCLTLLLHDWGMDLTWPYIGAPGSEGWASGGEGGWSSRRTRG